MFKIRHLNSYNITRCGISINLISSPFLVDDMYQGLGISFWQNVEPENRERKILVWPLADQLETYK